MKKRILAMLLAAMLMVGLLPVSALAADATSGTCGENVTWSFDEASGTLTISGEGEMTYWNWAFDRPWHYQRDSIKNVIIENGVTTVGRYAFEDCSELTSVTFSETVVKIYPRAFMDCVSLEEVDLPCGIESIYDEAFSNCDSLKSVKLPDELYFLGSYAFDDCDGLKKVEFSDTWGYEGSGFFADLEQYAFRNCTSLTEVNFGDTELRWGGGVFNGCSSLEKFVVDKENSLYSVENGILYSKDKTRLYKVPAAMNGEYKIPEGITVIDSGAFSDCIALSGVTVPESYGGCPFFTGCSGLTYVKLPEEGVEHIPYKAFMNCSALTEIIIPESVKSIGYEAFNGCTSLPEIKIPGSVTDIDWAPFVNCPNLEKIVLGENSPFCVDEYGVLYNDGDKTELIQAPGKLQGTYTIPNTVKKIWDRAFGGCTSVQEVIIPESITYIDHYTFYGASIEQVIIPASVSGVGRYAFANCTSLKKVELPETIEIITEGVFSGCTSLVDIQIPDSVTKIEGDAFRGCSALMEIEISESVTYIGYLVYEDTGVFGDCTSLQKAVILEGLRSIPEHMFINCSALTVVALPSTIAHIASDAFNSCTSLKDVYYAGTKEEWESIYISEVGNDPLLNATIHYGSGEVDACTHTPVTDTAVAATCTATGLTEGSHCSKCGEVLTAQEVVPATGHKSESVKGKAATCTATGLTDGAKCSVCGEVLTKQETIPALGHKFSGGKCTVCGAKDPNYVEPTPTPPAVTPTPTPPAGNNPFTDVPNNAWYAAPVLWAKANNVTGGKTETTFGPDDGCTRAQVVTFLWAANGKPEPKSMNNPFKDVADNAWYLKPVLWAVEQGITGGVAEGKFGPEQTCTRAQIATFLYAAAGKPEVSGKSSFKDVADSDWFAKPIIWAAQNEVTGGIGDGKFGPNNTCTRAQVVTFLYKVYG